MKKKITVSFIVYLAIFIYFTKSLGNFTCFIENAHPEGDGEESGHLEAELRGEFHFQLFYFKGHFKIRSKICFFEG